MVACSNNKCPLKKECQKHKKNSPESTVFTKHNFLTLIGQTSCDEFLYKPAPTARLRKDGNPKKSGGLRSNVGGRPKSTKQTITKDQALEALENLGYFIPNLLHLGDVINIAGEIGKTFDSVEEAKKVVAMLLLKFGGENFDSENPICNHTIIQEIIEFFIDRKPYDALVNI